MNAFDAILRRFFTRGFFFFIDKFNSRFKVFDRIDVEWGNKNVIFDAFDEEVQVTRCFLSSKAMHIL